MKLDFIVFYKILAEFIEHCAIETWFYCFL